MAAWRQDTMMNPPIEDLLDQVDSKFTLVTLAPAGPPDQLLLQPAGRGPGHLVPPQVTSVARKPLSIAFEEIGADKIA